MHILIYEDNPGQKNETSLCFICFLLAMCPRELSLCISCPQRAAPWLNIFYPHNIFLRLLGPKVMQEYSTTTTKYITTKP